MKTKSKIVILLICASNFGTIGTHVLADERSQLTFERYYQPYELNIEPNAPGYTLPLDLNDITNVSDFARAMPIDSVSDLVRENGFAIKHIDLPFQWLDAAILERIVCHQVRLGVEIPVVVEHKLFWVKTEYPGRIVTQYFSHTINDRLTLRAVFHSALSAMRVRACPQTKSPARPTGARGFSFSRPVSYWKTPITQ